MVMPVGHSRASVAYHLVRSLDASNANKGVPYRLSMTIGIAHFDAEHLCSVDGLLD
ncbi:MAG TPA: hypothetical protein VEE82_02140 [Thermodesulfovibrionales bacterium]|nr:hypothetical protein [Thermodesulfovibrionales bacterium]